MCIVEIRPGRGGQDAERFAASLAQSLTAWAARQGKPASTMSATRMITVALPRIPAASFR